MPYSALYILNLGPLNTGLTLVARLYDTSGVQVGSDITIGFTEIQNGDYQWYYTSFPTAFRGHIRIYDNTDRYISSVSVNPEEYEYLDMPISSIPSSLSGVGSNEVTFYTIDSSAEIIGGATVEVRPSGSSELVGFTGSNSSTGKAVFNLDSGNYAVSTRKYGSAFWSNPNYITVSGDMTYNLTGTRMVIEQPASEDMVRLYTYMSDLGMNPKSGVKALIWPSGYADSDGEFIFTSVPVQVESNASGYIYCDVFPNVPVRVKVTSTKFDKYFITPSSGTINMADL